MDVLRPAFRALQAVPLAEALEQYTNKVGGQGQGGAVVHVGDIHTGAFHGNVAWHGGWQVMHGPLCHGMGLAGSDQQQQAALLS